MSADQPTAETATGVRRRLPSSETVRAGLLTLWYLTVLIVGMTLLIALDLVVRLSALP